MADGHENNPSSEEAGDGQAEPSMEEILSSIRRIISEDEEPGEAKAADAPDADADAMEAETVEAAEEIAAEGETEAGEDVLELTRMVSDDGSVTDLAEENEPEAEMATEAGESDTSPEEEAPETAADENALELHENAPSDDGAEAPEPVEAGALEPTGEQLLADQTVTAATESFTELAKAVVKEDGPGMRLGANGDKSLEDIVKELLRPMLKEWLDQNLPSITEKLVRKEIERAARRAEEL